MTTAARRLLLVHAHPDDETIGSGTTMARYAAQPDTSVTLVVCTAGEEGEVLLADKLHLAAHHTDALGEHRREELAAAMGALGVSDWRWLGGFGRFRDSGMVGTPANDRPDCFWRADLLEAAAFLVRIIREVRPQVLVTYDDFGAYGHPDHIQAHRVAMYATLLAEAAAFRPELGAAHRITKIYWTAMPKSVVRAGVEAMRGALDSTDFEVPGPNDSSFGTPDELCTTAIDGRDFAGAKLAAMRAHSSQISLETGFFALSNNLGSPFMTTEYFTLVRGESAAPFDPAGRETDLFAGVRAE